ncbi:CHAT domain-containing protein [Flavobacterium cellulosilyticum]|uniref:CHAT domain-containing protein n=1 Tax=Flavobacterium cellulosilyticum TaxID=2541731 RepID=A0A4R5CLA8_9FLAO|nr:CHAT domain-containing tetratricopeptide repeat protein [Flavobacterium cellulosilyticum]TDD99410.1 CHAT domain-containing protein [Flavobacterium cellulosilyticum]
MIKIAHCFLLLSTLIIFGQNPLTQEDKIYNAVDAFTAKPTIDGLQKLDATEKDFWKNPKPKTKNELLAIVVLNCNKAYYENQIGQTSQAISTYEKALQVYQKNTLSNYDISEYCLKPLGNLYTIIGDYDNAENTIKHYYYLATIEKNQPQKIAAILNLSNVYQNTGRINQAIDLLEKTIENEKLTAVQKGTLLNNLGNNYMISAKGFLINPEPFAKAETSFKNAIVLLKTEKNQSQTVANCYLNLAAFNSHWENFDKANAYFAMAKKLVLESKNQPSRKLAKLYYEEANLLFLQKRYSEASLLITTVFKTLIPNYSNVTQQLPNQKSLYAETVLLDALDLQAALYWEQNQPKKALKAYALSFQIEALFSNLLVYENSKIINQIRIRNRTEKCIAIYDDLYKIENKITYLELAFQLQERTKSGVLKSYLSNRKTASIEEKQYLNQLQNWNTEIIKEQQKGNLANISKINEAIKKQNELMLSLKKTRTKNPILIEENIDLKALYAKLEKDKAMMVAYFSGFDKMYIFTLENKSIKLDYYWDNHTATPRIISFLNYFSDANKITDNISGYNHNGNNVYKMLKLPTNSTYKNLIIVPDGLLNFLPFEALITQESTTTNFANMHYLLNDFNIAYNNSASIYLNAKTHTNHKKTVLGIFPVFEKTAYELTFSKAEMQSIKSNFGGKFFDNSSATLNNFKTNAANYSILHLSTHADSGDTETPASLKFYDQEILYSELYNLNINPDLVVLSACETGIGKLYKSEGAMSVARGFQYAGAQNLLFSLWKVNDYTTSVFMDYFYKNIKKGLPYFEANAKAKRDFLNDKTISNAKKSPYYWSAFVYYGEIETANPPSNYYFYILALLILIGLFLVFKRYQK